MRIRIIFLLISCSFVTYSPENYAVSTQELGNVGTYAIPLTGAVAALLLKDYQGVAQLALATGIVQGSTQGLKLASHERRPNGNCCSSFPSGHTAAAFTGAAFVHFRYGFQYSVPLYLGSAYVAYSRVHTKAHYVQDVAVGALLAIAETYLSTTPYKDTKLSIVVDRGYAGIIYRKIFD